MDNVTITKTALLATLNSNLALYRLVYQETVSMSDSNYRLVMQRIIDGTETNPDLAALVAPPEDHESDYIAAIADIESAPFDELTLPFDMFAKYGLNNWDWISDLEYCYNINNEYAGNTIRSDNANTFFVMSKGGGTYDIIKYGEEKDA